MEAAGTAANAARAVIGLLKGTRRLWVGKGKVK